MNFAIRATVTRIAIHRTTFATGPDVFATLSIARANLKARVDALINARRIALSQAVADATTKLREAAESDIAQLRHARDAALGTREADLPSEPAADPIAAVRDAMAKAGAQAA